MPQPILDRLFCGRIPSVREFNREMDKLSLPERLRFVYPIFRLGFSDWNSLPARSQAFILRVVEHDRQLWLDFLLGMTVMGSLRYQPGHPEALMRAVKIVEYVNRCGKASLNHLAMALLTTFEYNYRLSTMGDYLRQYVILPEHALQYIGKLEIDSD